MICKDMKFTSQICTSKEQSEQLVALGLRKETADCVMIYYDGWHIGEAEHFDLDKDPVEPAWSLHRLIEMYSEHYVCEHINLKLLTYDTIIENIRLDILTGTFNKEYLEQ